MVDEYSDISAEIRREGSEGDVRPLIESLEIGGRRDHSNCCHEGVDKTSVEADLRYSVRTFYMFLFHKTPFG